MFAEIDFDLYARNLLVGLEQVIRDESADYVLNVTKLTTWNMRSPNLRLNRWLCTSTKRK